MNEKIKKSLKIINQIQKIVQKKKNGKNIENIFPNISDSSQITDNRWVIDTKAFSLPNTYKNIISAETSFTDEDTRE